MPYTEHPAFRSPPSSAKVWRYLDPFKFISLIAHERLYFVRLDLLTEDPFEGTVSRPTIQALSSELSVAANRPVDAGELALNLYHWISRSSFVSSWHMNEYESMAMWKIYSLAGSGIAIQSTFERLVHAVRPATEEVNIGLVEYRDYASEHIQVGNALVAALTKRRAFEYEHELRAITSVFGGDEDSRPTGISIIVDIEALIENVYVSPNFPEWQRAIIQDVIRQYHRAWLVRPSSLDAPPFT